MLVIYDLAMASDIVIANATLIDGTGAPARREDVGIAGGKIVPPGGMRSG
jgi:N-acyl-D-aspartate/D-glutamate deacylase